MAGRIQSVLRRGFDDFREFVNPLIALRAEVAGEPSRIVATRDTTVGADDYEVFQNFVTVGGAQSFSLPVTFTLPPGVAGGDVFWALQVDPPRPNSQNPTVEALETNNTTVSLKSTHIQQADLQANFADLVHVVTGASTRKGDVGVPGRIKVTVQNVVHGVAPRSCAASSRFLSRPEVLAFTVTTT